LFSRYFSRWLAHLPLPVCASTLRFIRLLKPYKIRLLLKFKNTKSARAMAD